MVPEQQRWFSTLFVLLLPYARSFKPPRSEPPAKCDTLIGYDCPSHYFCAGTKFNQQYGRCKCNPFYGFYGKHCQQKSGTSYLLLSLCVVLFVSGSANIYLNAVAVHRRMRKGTFELNSTGRTYLCNMICNLPVLSLGAGLAACAMNIDKHMFFHVYMREASVAAYFGFFILSCFSISFVWIERVEISVRGVQDQAVRNNRSLIYRSVLYGMSVLTVLLITIGFAVFRSIIYVVAYGCLVCIGTGVSYRYAGQRVYNLLVVHHSAGQIFEHQQAIADHIQSTASTVSTQCFIIAASFVVLFFTLPTATPTYEKQNDLPARWLQGQIPLFISAMAAVRVNWVVLSYLEVSAQQNALRRKSWRRKRVQPFNRLSQVLPQQRHEEPQDVDEDSQERGSSYLQQPMIHEVSGDDFSGRESSRFDAHSECPMNVNSIVPSSSNNLVGLSSTTDGTSHGGTTTGNSASSLLRSDTFFDSSYSHTGSNSVVELIGPRNKSSSTLSSEDELRSEEEGEQKTGGRAAGTAEKGSKRWKSKKRKGKAIRVLMPAPSGGSPENISIFDILSPSKFGNTTPVGAHIPFLLATVDRASHRVVGRPVIDHGEGNGLEDEPDVPGFVGSDDEDEGEDQVEEKRYRILPGSHAFVRCYGEQFLRVTWQTFPFGKGCGHPLLADSGMVLMAGEIEVDSSGRFMTRWLNRSGLYRPPSWAIGQSGLPIESAWLHVSTRDLQKMDPRIVRHLLDSDGLCLTDAPQTLSVRPAAVDTTAAAAEALKVPPDVSTNNASGRASTEKEADEPSLSTTSPYSSLHAVPVAPGTLEQGGLAAAAAAATSPGADAGKEVADDAAGTNAASNHKIDSNGDVTINSLQNGALKHAGNVDTDAAPSISPEVSISSPSLTIDGILASIGESLLSPSKTWVMRLDPELVLEYSVPQSTYMAARNAVYSYVSMVRSLRRRVHLRYLRVRAVKVAQKHAASLMLDLSGQILTFDSRSGSNFSGGGGTSGVDRSGYGGGIVTGSGSDVVSARPSHHIVQHRRLQQQEATEETHMDTNLSRTAATTVAMGRTALAAANAAREAAPDGIIEDMTSKRDLQQARNELKEMRQELVESGTLEVYKEGAQERRRTKSSLGFSRNTNLVFPS